MVIDTIHTIRISITINDISDPLDDVDRELDIGADEGYMDRRSNTTPLVQPNPDWTKYSPPEPGSPSLVQSYYIYMTKNGKKWINLYNNLDIPMGPSN